MAVKFLVWHSCTKNSWQPRVRDHHNNNRATGWVSRV